MEDSTMVYVKLGDGRQVIVQLCHLSEVDPTPLGGCEQRELTVAEMDAVAAKLSTKDYSCAPFF